jgi:hypothetical protein
VIARGSKQTINPDNENEKKSKKGNKKEKTKEENEGKYRKRSVWSREKRRMRTKIF